VAAQDQAAQRVAIAGLYPLWGALWGGLAAAWFLRQSHFVALLLPLLWIAVAGVEDRLLPVTGWWHILGATALCPIWFYFLGQLDPMRAVLVALASHTISRALLIVMAWISRPTAAGIALSRKLNSIAAGFAIACGAVTAFLFGFRPGFIMILVGILTLRLIRQRYYTQLGGVNTTALSLTQHATELTTLVIGVYIR
jgi:cobalamin synthase